MSEPVKLTIEEAETFAVTRCDDASRIARQLADTMRENERLRGAIQYVANGEDTTADDLIAEYESYRNKHSDDPETLPCATCGNPMPQTAVPAERAWCSDGCYEKRAKTSLPQKSFQENEFTDKPSER